MDSVPTILVVDDDPDICKLLVDYLNDNGYHTLHAEDGRAMWRVLDQNHIDLVVLDLNLPGEDGLSLCRKLRSQSVIPVVMLTAKGEALDRILGLEMGADDYLPKPCEPRELLARIRSVLRRSSLQTERSPIEKAQRILFLGWTFDLIARHLVRPDGMLVMLSAAEFRLLRVFLEHANEVLNRDQLINLAHGRGADTLDRSVDLQISRLRTKLGEETRAPKIIKTVRNGGYVLAANVQIEVG
ncbi:response regulator [Massilia varians]|jgi:two-component system, OmpR family, response regulator|uniref:response regulator n=1 Tax=Massilia TaxID=149698 RepID=UPI0004856FDA|nr:MULTISPECIES: response regulator [Massilia]KFC76336.1 Two component transcriptional regulator, winged helix family [Massilia sp. LC238]